MATKRKGSKSRKVRIEEIWSRESRQFLTYGPDSDVWQGGDFSSRDGKLGRFQGCLVRLLPPAGVDDQTIADLERRLYEAGAAKVKVLAREAAQALVSRDVVQNVTAKTKRDTVLELVQESSSDDRDALRELVVSTMDREGV